MDEQARQALQRVIAERGSAVWEQPHGVRSLRGLLLDYCRGGCRPEINVLLRALEENVPARLASANHLTPGVAFRQLVLHMQGELRMDLDAACWAVETWALALGSFAEADMRAWREELVSPAGSPNNRPGGPVSVPSPASMTQPTQPTQQQTLPTQSPNPAPKPSRSRAQALTVAGFLVMLLVAAVIAPGVVAKLSDGTASEVSDVDDVPPAVAEARLPADVTRWIPAGYVLDTLVPAPAPLRQDGDTATYEVPLRSTEARYWVPIGPARLSPSLPEGLRARAERLVLADELEPGMDYRLDEAQMVRQAGEAAVGQWRIRQERVGDAWRTVGADSVRVATSASPGGAPGRSGVAVSATELDALRARRAEAVAAHARRWERLQQEVEEFRARRVSGAPGRCRSDPGALVQEVVRLTSTCPRLPDAAERGRCVALRNQVNAELGACERQNERHEAYLRDAERAVREFRRTRTQALFP